MGCVSSSELEPTQDPDKAACPKKENHPIVSERPDSKTFNKHIPVIEHETLQNKLQVESLEGKFICSYLQ